MSRPSLFVVPVILSIGAVAVLAGCGKNIQLESRWLDREITIDAYEGEWREALTAIQKERFTFGAFNDNDYLYICLMTRDRSLQNQVMGMGFTMWFSPGGKQEDAWGIRYPLGRRASGMSLMDNQGISSQDGRPQSFDTALDELEIIERGEDNGLRLLLAEAQGIEIKAFGDLDALIYELKIPLRRGENAPYAVGAQAGQEITIGLETQVFDREARMGQRRPDGTGGQGGIGTGGRGGAGMGGRGGGMPPGGGQGMRPQMASPLNIWATLALAGGVSRTGDLD